jgi:hypothetical protein
MVAKFLHDLEVVESLIDVERQVMMIQDMTGDFTAKTIPVPLSSTYVHFHGNRFRSHHPEALGKSECHE